MKKIWRGVAVCGGTQPACSPVVELSRNPLGTSFSTVSPRRLGQWEPSREILPANRKKVLAHMAVAYIPVYSHLSPSGYGLLSCCLAGEQTLCSSLFNMDDRLFKIIVHA